MTVVQVKLRKQGTTAEMTTWVDKKKDLKKGCLVSLKEDKNTLWEVLEMYGETDSKLLHTGWHVGGL